MQLELSRRTECALIAKFGPDGIDASHIANVKADQIRFTRALSDNGLFELAVELLSRRIIPRWAPSVGPTLKLAADRKSDQELESGGLYRITEGYCGKEWWMLMRAAATLQESRIPWTLVRVSDTEIALARPSSGCVVTSESN